MGGAREGGHHLRQRAVLGRPTHALQPPAQDALILLRQQLYGQVARRAHLRPSISFVAQVTAPRMSFTCMCQCDEYYQNLLPQQSLQHHLTHTPSAHSAQYAHMPTPGARHCMAVHGARLCHAAPQGPTPLYSDDARRDTVTVPSVAITKEAGHAPPGTSLCRRCCAGCQRMPGRMAPALATVHGARAPAATASPAEQPQEGKSLKGLPTLELHQHQHHNLAACQPDTKHLLGPTLNAVIDYQAGRSMRMYQHYLQIMQGRNAATHATLEELVQAAPWRHRCTPQSRRS